MQGACSRSELLYSLPDIIVCCLQLDVVGLQGKSGVQMRDMLRKRGIVVDATPAPPTVDFDQVREGVDHKLRFGHRR